jgi:gluconate 2-dehydrogenase alpha chain
VRQWGKPYSDHILGWQDLGVVRIQPDALPYADHFVDIDPRHRHSSGVGMPLAPDYFPAARERAPARRMEGDQAGKILKEMGATKTWEGPHFTVVARATSSA